MNELIARFLDDRRSLSDEELQALARHLEAHPDELTELRGQLACDELLSRRFDEERGGFVARVKQAADGADVAAASDESLSENVGQTSCLPVRAASCRPEHGAGKPREPSGWKPDPHLQTGSEEFVAAVERRAGLKPPRSLFWKGRRWFASSPRVAWSFTAAVACVALVASVLWLVPSPAAQIAATQGDVRVWRKQVTHLAAGGFKLQAGDWLLTGTNGSVTVAFPGETTRLDLGTNAEFGVVTALPGKQLKLVAGTMRASVARQSASHPMLIRTPTARAEVLGTKFELSATELTTRLRVEEGRVLFAGTNDESGVVIEATQSGVVTGSAPVAVLAPPPAQTLGYALLAHWKLDGNGADASGQSNALALGNGVVFTNGRVGQALDLRAAKVDVESPRLVLPPVFTLSLWLNLNPGGPQRSQPLIGFDGQHVGVDDFFLSLNPTFPGSTVALNVRGRQMGSQALSKRSVIAVGRWQHLAVVVDSTQGRVAFHVDGREVTEQTGLRQGFRLAGPLLIGRRVKGGPQPFDGQLDDIRIYGRALSAAEITALAEGKEEAK